MFEAIGLRAEGFITQWLLPCGAMGAVLVGSWLVEAKKSVIENRAPVLTWVFTPNRTAALGENLILLVNLAWALIVAAVFPIVFGFE